MKLGVNGASGKLGRAVLNNLAKSGGSHTLIGISRSPETIPSPAEGRRGDYDDPASLVSAYQGLDRLLLIPSADLRPGVRGGQFDGRNRRVERGWDFARRTPFGLSTASCLLLQSSSESNPERFPR